MEPDSVARNFSENSVSFRDQSDAWLLQSWKKGREQAAEILFDRYSMRLVALIASRLNPRYRSEIAPEEVVQSALGSFFAAVDRSRIEVSEGISLWRLLATFARRKMTRRIERLITAKRGGNQHRISIDLLDSQDAYAFDNQRQIDDEFWRAIDSELPSELSSVVRGLLAGHTQRELAEILGTTERTVRRRLTRVRELIGPGLEERKQTESVAPPTALPRVNYNEFVLGKLIGTGGLGKVYRASMQKDGQTVAVKFLRRAFWENEGARASFLREINLASQLKHTSILRYLGYGESPHGGPYLLSEWIDGRPLADAERRPTPQFAKLMIQVCDAIQAIHDCGLVHGDLTPANILIDTKGSITVTDFGFSQRSLQSPSAVLGGTLGFAAPEQLDSAFGNIGLKTDVYAIGALIDWHFRGLPPNDGANLGSMLSRTLEPTHNTQNHTTEIPAMLAEALKGSLCHCVADRTLTAQEIAELLSQYLQSIEPS
ncbi:MAG: protein kinase [Planctomycetota bacterium]